MVEGQRTQLFVSEMFSAHANIIHAWKQDVFKRNEKKQQQKKSDNIKGGATTCPPWSMVRVILKATSVPAVK